MGAKREGPTLHFLRVLHTFVLFQASMEAVPIVEKWRCVALRSSLQNPGTTGGSGW